MPPPSVPFALATASCAVLLAACSPSSASSSASSSGAVGPSSPAASAPSSVATGPLAGLAPVKVLARAQSALAGAKSVHFVARGAGQDGSLSGFDVRAASSGDATGSVYFSGDTLKLVRRGNDVYLSGHKALLADLAPQGTNMTGKWLKVPADQPEIAGILQVASLRTGLGGVLLPRGALSFGPSKNVDGEQTVAVVESGATPLTVYVAAEGTPYPLLVQSAAAGPAGTSAEFLEWNAPVVVTPPPASAVVTIRP
jgi:hypothetical protein